MNEIDIHFSETDFKIFRKFCQENNITKTKHLTKSIIKKVSSYRGIGEQKLKRIEVRLSLLRRQSVLSQDKLNSILDLNVPLSSSYPLIKEEEKGIVTELYSLFHSISNKIGNSKSFKEKSYLEYISKKKFSIDISNLPKEVLNLRVSTLLSSRNNYNFHKSLGNIKIIELFSPSFKSLKNLHISLPLIENVEKTLFSILSLEEITKSIFNGLSENQILFLELRFLKKYTLEKCGKIFGFTRERARQIEGTTLKKIFEKKEMNELLFSLRARNGFAKALFRERVENLIKNPLLLEILKYYPKGNILFNEKLDLFIFEEFNRVAEIENYLLSLPDIFKVEHYLWEISDYLSGMDIRNWDDTFFENCLSYFNYTRYGEFFTKKKRCDSLFIETYFEQIREVPFRIDKKTFPKFKYEIEKYFSYTLAGNLKSLYGVLDRYQDMIKTGPLTYLHISKIDYDYNVLSKVKDSLKALKKPYITLEEAFALYKDELFRGGITTSYTFYYLLKYEFKHEFKIGSGNSMNLYFDYNIASKSREDIIYETLKNLGKPMDKNKFCSLLRLKEYSLNDTLFKSERFLFFDRSLIGLSEWIDILPEEKKRILEIAKNHLEVQRYILISEIIEVIEKDKNLLNFIKRTSHLNRYFISWFLKRSDLKLSGNFNLLYLEDSPIKNTSELILSRIGSRIVDRNRIYTLCNSYRFKDATRSNMCSRLFDENKIVEIDFDRIILTKNFLLTEEIIKKTENIILKEIGERNFISLNLFTDEDLETLFSSIPLPEPYTWNVYLLKSILKFGTKLKLLLKQNADYRYDSIVFIKNNLEYNTLEDFIYSIIKDNFIFPANERNICLYLEDLGLMPKKQPRALRKLPFSVSCNFHKKGDNYL